MTFRNTQFGRIAARAVVVLSFLSLLAVPGAIEASAATKSFDGNWKIYIFGGQDNCTFGYRLPITISDGNVLYNGRKVHPTVIGVNSAGAVAINLGSGSNHVTGTGALASNRGSGRWAAPQFRCAGYWRAEKR